MAKQVKLTYQGEQVYPQTITDAIADVNEKMMLSDIISEIRNSVEKNTNKYIINSENDRFLFSDISGHTVAIIDNNGITSIGYYDADGNEIIYNPNTGITNVNGSFANKNIFTLCDSLGSGGHWATTLCNLIGAKPFNQTKNGSSEMIASGLSLSCGGAATLQAMSFGWDGHPQGLSSQQQRAVNFVNMSEAQYGSKDVLIIENVNDFNFFDENRVPDSEINDLTTAKPVFIEKTYHIQPQNFFSYNNARDYFYNNIEECLSGITIEPHVGIYMTYGANSNKITVVGSSTIDGDLNININGIDYTFDITSGMTENEILNIINITNFEGFSNVLSGNTISIMPDNEESNDLLFTVTNTSNSNITYTQETANSYCKIVFTSTDINNWLNTTYWVQHSSIGCHRAIMGLIEYLSNKCQKTKLIYLIMPRYPYTFDKFKNADGTPDVISYKKDSKIVSYERFCKMQKKICEFYGIEYIDVNGEIGWNYANMKQYYGTGTIHWKDTGHNSVAEFLARKLK